MEMNIGREIASLQKMTVKQLQQKFAEVFGELTNGHNKQWLVKRIAWRLQVLAEGGLTERARLRAAEIANEADLRMNPPQVHIESPTPPVEEKPVQVLKFSSDERLPPPGTLLSRVYKGQRVQVLVRNDGFEYEGEVFTSLSAVAKQITGSHCNGFLFFRLTAKGANG